MLVKGATDMPFYTNLSLTHSGLVKPETSQSTLVQVMAYQTNWLKARLLVNDIITASFNKYTLNKETLNIKKPYRHEQLIFKMLTDTNMGKLIITQTSILIRSHQKMQINWYLLGARPGHMHQLVWLRLVHADGLVPERHKSRDFKVPKSKMKLSQRPFH